MTIFKSCLLWKHTSAIVLAESMRKRLVLDMHQFSELVWALFDASHWIVVVEGRSVALVLMIEALMRLVHAEVFLLGRLCRALLLAGNDDTLTSRGLLVPPPL